jgi:phage terminase large subunit
MVILFFQYFKGKPQIIDIIEEVGSNIKAMVPKLQEKPYVYGWHFLPHDGTVASLNDGVNRLATLAEAGITNASVLKRQGVSIGIGYVEDWLPKTLINLGTTGDFNRKIRLYKKKFNPNTGDFMGHDHNTNSHVADALRYMATALHHYWNEKGEFFNSPETNEQEYESDLATVTFS